MSYPFQQLHLSISHTGGPGGSPQPELPPPDQFQSPCIRDRLTGHLHCQRITAQLPFIPNHPRHPPDAGGIEQQRLNAPLQTVHQRIPPANVGQLMGENVPQRFRRQFENPARRQQNDRPEDTHDHRFGHPLREENRRQLAQTEPLRDVTRLSIPLCRDRGAALLQPDDEPPAE